MLRVPEEAREILGHDMKIIADTTALIALSAGTSYVDVLRSLELIQNDIQLRLDKEKSEASKSMEK